MAVPHQAHNDFNGDSRSDILWRSDTGVLGESLGQPDGGFAGNALVNVPVSTDWQVAGIGDFNGDDRSDILWRNSSTGVISESLGQPDGGFAGNALVTVAVSTDWQIAGIGDFNGDGRSDILWRNSTTGVISESLGQSDGGFAGNALVTVAVDRSWQIAGIGDFNGDGRSDILWRLGPFVGIAGNGWSFSESLGQPDGGFAGNPIVNVHVAGKQFVAIGDFNGDGRSDILWRDDGSSYSNALSGFYAGTVYESLGQPDGSFADNSAATMVLNTDWHVASVGDYNGDGTDDIMLQNKDGQIAEWLANSSGAFAVNPAIDLNPGTQWHMQDPFIHDPFA
jgi:FG-GAP-like repeat